MVKVPIMKRAFAVLLAGAFIVIAGCKDQAPPPKAGIAKPKAAVSAPPPVKEEAKAEKEVYVYEQKGRRDPFASLIQITKEKPRRVAGKRPIENYDVDEIKLIAILWENKEYYALITLPDNKSYTIKKGMTLGLYGGKVVDITRDKVLIQEQVKDYRGQLKTKDTILKLRKEGE
jgi:type IV pilus assembly protein PilP